MTFQPARQLFTVEEYYKMVEVGIIKPTDRVELINGEIIKMTPIKSNHASIVDELVEQIIVQLHGKIVVRGQNPIILGETSEPEPDVVIAKFKKDKYRDNHPKAKDILLVIEVADSSLKYDKTIKRSLYAKAGIPEYWIINIPDKKIEIYRNSNGKDYTTKRNIKSNRKIVCQLIDFELKYTSIFS